MKNKLVLLILTVALCVLMCMTVPADTDKAYVYDSTGRFTADEIAAYNTRATELISNYDIAPYFVVTNEAEGTNAIQLTEDFYEEHAAGTNCVIMLLTENTYYVLPIGLAADVFEYQEEFLYDAFYGKIYMGETYSSGALAYLDSVEDLIQKYNNDQNSASINTDDKSGTRVVDNAEVLEPIFENTMSMELDDISTKYQCDIVFLTVPSTYGTGVTAFADDYFDYNGYGYGPEYDGILFLISMQEREWAFSTCGNAINIFNDDVLAYMEDEIIPYLRKNNYEDALSKYVSLCENFVSSADSGVIYDKDSLPAPSFKPANVLVAIIAGLLVAVMVVLFLKGQLKSVKKKSGAHDYMKDGSMKLSVSKDSFLYSHVSRRVKPKSSSSGGTHRSSSGRSHGGRSGRF